MIKRFFGFILIFFIKSIGGFLIIIWLIGAYHGGGRHDVKPFDDGIGFAECFYYGLERFWHKMDYQELNDYVSMSSVLLLNSNVSTQSMSKIEIIQSKKALKKFLKYATSDEYDYVKKGAYYFMKYFDSNQSDFVKELKNGKPITLRESVLTIKTKKISSKFGMRNEIIHLEKSSIQNAREYNDVLYSKDKSIISKRKLFIKYSTDLSIKTSKSRNVFFKQLFKD
jgi:hypothetical protein